MSELHRLRRYKNKKSVWVTYNVPDGGYAECTNCGSPSMNDGLCELCGQRLMYLEKEA